MLNLNVFVCVCIKLRAEIIVMTGRIVNAGVIHAVIEFTISVTVI